MSAGERRDDSSRDAPTDARETRRRYSADEVSRCGRWMQRAGGVALFPEGRDERMRCLPSSRGCTARLCFGPTPGGTLLGEADCTGLDPEAVYVYGEWVEGRARRPPQRASTVARNKAARWKANQHRASTRWLKIRPSPSSCRSCWNGAPPRRSASSSRPRGRQGSRGPCGRAQPRRTRGRCSRTPR